MLDIMAGMSWGYIAGYFDGEGHVSLHPTSYGIQWVNTHRTSLEAMRNFMDAGIIDKGRMGVNLIKYDLRIRRIDELHRIAPILIDHCIVKQPALIKLIDLVKNKVGSPNYGKIRKTFTDDELTALYVNGLSCNEIAEIIGVHNVAVRNQLKRIGIALRTHKEAMILAASKGRTYSTPRKLIENTALIDRLYWQHRLSIRELADRFNVSRTAVESFMKRNNIPVRPFGKRNTIDPRLLKQRDDSTERAIS